MPWVLIVGVWVFIMRRASKGIAGGAGGLFSFGESKARLFTEATRIDGNREFFRIGAEHGVFNKLQLQALGNGSSRIHQVYVESGSKIERELYLSVLLNRDTSKVAFVVELGGFKAMFAAD